MTGEWVEWHRAYTEDPSMGDRLRLVQSRICEALHRRPPGPIRVISACAGDGRDLLGVLAEHPRRRDVRARLVELSPELAAAGRDRAAREGLRDVEFIVGDASSTSAYSGGVPADVLLFCGVFGNISDADVRATIRHLPELCARDATVIWTRGRFEPDLTRAIRGWFAEEGFGELSFETVPNTTRSVGAHRLTAVPRPFRPEVKLFTFLPREERPSTLARDHPGVRASTGTP
jgi:hypothetical protein